MKQDEKTQLKMRKISHFEKWAGGEEIAVVD